MLLPLLLLSWLLTLLFQLLLKWFLLLLLCLVLVLLVLVVVVSAAADAAAVVVVVVVVVAVAVVGVGVGVGVVVVVVVAVFLLSFGGCGRGPQTLNPKPRERFREALGFFSLRWWSPRLPRGPLRSRPSAWARRGFGE